MEPLLLDGERIVVNKFVYRFQPVERGDVVVFWYPRDPSVSFIKRVVALPGDLVEMRVGQLLVNGMPVREAYLPESFRDADNYPPTEVRKGYYFVLGDHRRSSNDSRTWARSREVHLRAGGVPLLAVRPRGADPLSILRRFPPAVILAGSFAVVIASGALLLSLPFAHSGEPVSFLDALFTSTSAACVTGLTVVDTGSRFSPAGQAVVLALIQVGGLGLMTFAVFVGCSWGARSPSRTGWSSRTRCTTHRRRGSGAWCATC